MKNVFILASLSLLLGCSDGKDGQPGAFGGSCSVQDHSEGVLVTCPDGSSTLIKDGTNGVSAPVSPYMVTEVIRPCEESGSKELILRLYNGQLLAHYSDGVNQYLAYLFPGTWRLTDGSNCQFTVNADMEVSW